MDNLYLLYMNGKLKKLLHERKINSYEIRATLYPLKRQLDLKTAVRNVVECVM